MTVHTHYSLFFIIPPIQLLISSFIAEISNRITSWWAGVVEGTWCTSSTLDWPNCTGEVQGPSVRALDNPWQSLIHGTPRYSSLLHDNARYCSIPLDLVTGWYEGKGLSVCLCVCLPVLSVCLSIYGVRGATRWCDIKSWFRSILLVCDMRVWVIDPWWVISLRLFLIRSGNRMTGGSEHFDLRSSGHLVLRSD